jgi:uridine kinase
MHDKYVEPSKQYAHIIVPGGLNNVALDMLESYLLTHIKN